MPEISPDSGCWPPISPGLIMDLKQHLRDPSLLFDTKMEFCNRHPMQAKPSLALTGDEAALSDQ